MTPDIVRPIRQILARIRGEAEQPDRPFGLSEGEFATLKKLHGTDAWTVLCRMVDRQVRIAGEKLLRRDATAEEIHFERGVIQGLRRIPSLIEYALEQKDASDDRREQQRERRAADRARQRRINSYGHPSRRGS